MPIARSKPVRFVPTGLCDAVDGSLVFPGACRSLQNLIFDQGNPGYLVCRPGVGLPVTVFAPFSTPGYISAHIGVGTRIYGMVASAGNAGKDQVFCYDTATSTFVAIAGIANANSPTSPAVSGPWTPPTMVVVGDYVVVTHPGFQGVVANGFGTLKISTMTWSAQTTGTNALPSIPVSVANFNNRAYFACGNQSFATDALNPLVMTNAGQALTHGDTTPVLGYEGLPVANLAGGTVPALIVFKANQIRQVLGDPAITGTWSETAISTTQGCTAVRTIQLLPQGIVFIGSDGASLIDVSGNLRPLVFGKEPQSDIRLPFTNMVVPSRAAAGYVGNVYRVCAETTVDTITATNDYWFDTTRGRWSGPHTFPYDCCSEVGGDFYVSGQGAKLYKSQPNQTQASVFLDDASPLSVGLLTAFLPNTSAMQELQIVESTLELSSSAKSLLFDITALDEELNTLANCGIAVDNLGAEWGDGSLWGSGKVWRAFPTVPKVFTVPWPNPVVTQKFGFQVSASSQSAIKIGPAYFRYQLTGYTNA